MRRYIFSVFSATYPTYCSELVRCEVLRSLASHLVEGLALGLSLDAVRYRYNFAVSRCHRSASLLPLATAVSLVRVLTPVTLVV